MVSGLAWRPSGPLINLTVPFTSFGIRIATGRVNFDGFSNIAGHFLEEEDAEAMQQELKEAFRLYDREGNGYITTSTLKEILGALDDKLNSADLDGIIAEIDTDGSGTVDFDGKFTIFVYDRKII